MVRRGVGLIERFDGPDAAKGIKRKRARERRNFSSHARLEIADEVELVDDVRTTPQRVNADRKIHRWRDRAHRFERCTRG